jgi:hypothetical protein
MTKKLTKELVNERINDRGIELIGEYITNKTKSQFECIYGHRWLARPGDILKGIGCPHCAGLSPLSKELVNERINERGIELISDHTNTRTKLEFVCINGHKWMALSRDVMMGKGCPHCATYGFDRTIPGYFYILLFDTFLKYGITNNLEQRLKDHAKNGRHTVHFMKLFDVGQLALDLENIIKKRHGGKFMSKEQCPDGHTETLCLSKLQEIMTTISD